MVSVRHCMAFRPNHEDADARMLLHVKLISKRNNTNIVIHTPDTDVFVICLATPYKINYSLFIGTGT